MATINARTRDGTWQKAKIYYPHKGLATQKGLESGWTVVHLGTGEKIGRHWLTRAEAKACQDALLALGIDWALPGAKLRRLPRAMRQRIAAIAYPHLSEREGL